MKITDKIKQEMKVEWGETGFCASCGWHAAFYEVEDFLVEQLEDDDIDIDHNGDKYVVAYCENDIDHRDIRVYLNQIGL